MTYYIVYDPKETESMNAHILFSEQELYKWLEDGSIDEDALIFEATKVRKVVITTEKYFEETKVAKEDV